MVPSREHQAMQDPKTEAFLNRGQWRWAYDPEVTFDKIDTEHCADNPARLHRKIDEDRACQYAEAMAAGDEFPAIVLLAPSDRGLKPYDVATGMHRIEAAELHQAKDKERPKRLDAYIVTEPDQYRRQVLIRKLNTIEGQSDTLQEQILHVLYLYDTFKIPVPTLAKEWHLKENSLRGYIKAEQAKQRARKLGFDLASSKYSKTLLGSLGSIHSDRVFVEIGKFITNSAKIPLPQVIDELCRNVKDIRDEARALEVVQRAIKDEEERQHKEQAKSARTKQGPAQSMIANAVRFNRHLAGLQGIPRLFLNTLTDTDKVKARGQLEDVIAHAKQIIHELERLAKINAGFADAAE